MTKSAIATYFQTGVRFLRVILFYRFGPASNPHHYPPHAHHPLQREVAQGEQQQRTVHPHKHLYCLPLKQLLVRGQALRYADCLADEKHEQ